MPKLGVVSAKSPQLSFNELRWIIKTVYRTCLCVPCAQCIESLMGKTSRIEFGFRTGGHSRAERGSGSLVLSVSRYSVYWGDEGWRQSATILRHSLSSTSHPQLHIALPSSVSHVDGYTVVRRAASREPLVGTHPLVPLSIDIYS